MTKRRDTERLEARRLRQEERLSLREIADRLGVALSAVSRWVREDPLTSKERGAKIREKHPGPKLQPPDSKFYVIVKDQELSSSQVGNIAEAAVLFRLCLRGFSVFGSVFDGDRVDWLAQRPGGQVHRLQVKAVSAYSYGLPHISLRRQRRHINAGRREAEPVRYSPGDFDFIVGYDIRTDIAYVFSEAETSAHNRSISVTDDAAERWDKLT